MKRATILVLAGIVASSAMAGNFTIGDLAVFQAGTGTLTSNVTGSILEVSTTGAGLISTTAIADGGTAANGLRFSGSASSTGYLSLSDDAKLLSFTGANGGGTAVNVNTLLNRGVGTLDYFQSYNLATTYTGVTANQTRSATTVDGTNWFIGDQSGLFTNGGTTASPTGNFRKVHAFGGSVYGMTASATLAPVGTFASTTGSTYTALAGLGVGATSMQDFYLVKSNPLSTSYDILYTLAATGATAGTIAKYSLVGGTWVANGSATTSFGGFGLCARSVIGGPIQLFATTGTGASTNNSVVGMTDGAGYNTTIALSSSTTLYTTTGSQYLKGIDFVPVPEPGSMMALGLGAAAILRRRRK